MTKLDKILVGSSGFVGSTLIAQTKFDGTYNSKNSKELVGLESRLLICAAAPAQKWIANAHPTEDLANIEDLIANLSQTSAAKAVLISTVDVFGVPLEVSESDTPQALEQNHYGRNRRYLETVFQEMFTESTIVRLPGLVGSGLRKNALYDLKNGNEIQKLNGASTFQFYPMESLWRDLQIALQESLTLIHLTSEPLELGKLARDVFGVHLERDESTATRYDFRTEFGRYWHSSSPYQYSQADSLRAIESFARS